MNLDPRIATNFEAMQRIAHTMRRT